MATVRKTIMITDQQDAWIAAQIAAGNYADESDAIRDLIERKQKRSSKAGIRPAMIDIGQRGEPEPSSFGAQLLACEGSIDRDIDLGIDRPTVGKEGGPEFSWAAEFAPRADLPKVPGD